MTSVKIRKEERMVKLASVQGDNFRVWSFVIYNVQLHILRALQMPGHDTSANMPIISIRTDSKQLLLVHSLSKSGAPSEKHESDMHLV